MSSAPATRSRNRCWAACGLAVACEPDGTLGSPSLEHELDAWIVSRLHVAIELAGERLDGYDAPGAVAAVATFADDLCGRYAREVRGGARAGDPVAAHVLRDCLVTLARLLAPFTPFVADEVYERLDGGEPSVHLTDWPVAGEPDLQAASGPAHEGPHHR